MTRPLASLRHDLLTIIKAGIAAVDAGRLVERALGGRDGTASIAIPEGFLHVVAVGKASRPMAATMRRLFGSRIRTGVIVGVESAATVGAPFESIVGGHPTPTADSERAGRRVLAIAESCGADETLVVLLSGGASALMAVPAEGVTLEHKRAATEQLLRAGADIYAMNTVRKHLSAIKGGWLAARAGGPCRALAISDVVGDDLSVIGSGPTVADASTFDDALAVVQGFGGRDAFPKAVIDRLERRGSAPSVETPKPGDARLARAETTLIGGRHDAMAGAATHAESLGYHVVRVDAAVVGEARATAPTHVQSALAASVSVERPICIVSSGETTVRVRGKGKGGRNQEFALSSADALASGRQIVALASAGTDGIDGPTDAAGAIADSTTIERARAAGLDPRALLERNDAYTFFAALGDLIHTGPTDTNVGDLQVILVA